MKKLNVKIESISGIVPDWLTKPEITSSVSQTKEGRITLFSFALSTDIKLIEFLNLVGNCKCEMVKYEPKNRTITLREH